jgi:hypothetical protein
MRHRSGEAPPERGDGCAMAYPSRLAPRRRTVVPTTSTAQTRPPAGAETMEGELAEQASPLQEGAVQPFGCAFTAALQASDSSLWAHPPLARRWVGTELLHFDSASATQCAPADARRRRLGESRQARANLPLPRRREQQTSWVPPTMGAALSANDQLTSVAAWRKYRPGRAADGPRSLSGTPRGGYSSALHTPKARRDLCSSR